MEETDAVCCLARGSVILQNSERTWCNSSTFVGEILSSHDLKSAVRSTLTTSKRRLWLGRIHDVATSEQFRSDCVSSSRWPMISSRSSCGRTTIVLKGSETRN